jgi:uncharacterized protein (DUF2384 family)
MAQSKIHGLESSKAPAKTKTRPMPAQPEINAEEQGRVAFVFRARETFGSTSKTERWLNRPNAIFNGMSPLEAYKSKPQEVIAELVRIDHGVYI